MQAYKGYNTITNKVPFGERAGVEHVLMDFKEFSEQYVVGQWVHDATRAVSSSHNRVEFSSDHVYGLDQRCTRLAKSSHRRRWDCILDPAPHLSRSACSRTGASLLIAISWQQAPLGRTLIRADK
jgi:hypothetical protein